jgi:predicted amidohydrolase
VKNLLDVVLLVGGCIPKRYKSALERNDGILFDQVEIAAVISKTQLATVKKTEVLSDEMKRLTY